MSICNICTHIFITYIYMCIHTYLRITRAVALKHDESSAPYIYTYLHTHIRIYIHISIHIHIYIHIYIYIWIIYIYIYHICLNIYITHIYIYVYTHIPQNNTRRRAQKRWVQCATGIGNQSLQFIIDVERWHLAAARAVTRALCLRVVNIYYSASTALLLLTLRFPVVIYSS